MRELDVGSTSHADPASCQILATAPLGGPVGSPAVASTRPMCDTTRHSVGTPNDAASAQRFVAKLLRIGALLQLYDLRENTFMRRKFLFGHMSFVQQEIARLWQIVTQRSVHLLHQRTGIDMHPLGPNQVRIVQLV